MPVAEAAQRVVIRMTLEDIKAMTCDYITAEQAASATHTDINRVRGYVRNGDPNFPALPGRNIKIKRLAFLKAQGAINEEEKPTVEQLMEKLCTKLDDLKDEIHQVAMTLKPKEAPQ